MYEKVDPVGKTRKRQTPYLTMDAWMQSASVLISNALGDDLIRITLASFGYGDVKLKEGLALHAEVAALQANQKKEYGDRYQATEDVARARDEALEAYTRSMKLARIALRDRTDARAAMMLDGARNKSLSGWIGQAESFYVNLLKDPVSLADMARFGCTAASLGAEHKLVKDISASWNKARRESGEAVGSTNARDKKMDEFALWVSDLRSVCKIAFASEPSRLLILGIMR